MRWKKLSIYPAAMMAVAALSMVGQSCWAQSFTRIKFSDDTAASSVQENTANDGSANGKHTQMKSQAQGVGCSCDGQAVGCSSQACDSGCGGQAVGCSSQACDSGCGGSGCDSMAGGQLNGFGGCGCFQRKTLRSRFGLDNPIQSGPATNLRLRSRGVYCDGVCQSGCDSCQSGLFNRSGFGQGQGLLSRNSGCPDGGCGTGSGLLGRSSAGSRLASGFGNGCPDGGCETGSGLFGRSGAGSRLASGFGNGGPDGGSGAGILSGLRSRFAGLGGYEGSGDRSRDGGLLANGGGLGRRGMGYGRGYGDGYGEGLGALRRGCLDGRCGLAGCGLCKGGLLGPQRGEIPHTTQPNFGGDGMGGAGQAATFAYPYYTVRAPRDFLQDNPPTIGW